MGVLIHMVLTMLFNLNIKISQIIMFHNGEKIETKELLYYEDGRLKEENTFRGQIEHQFDHLNHIQIQYGQKIHLLLLYEKVLDK